MPLYGYTCKNCGKTQDWDVPLTTEFIGSDGVKHMMPNWNDLENRAGAAGWINGHWDGQGEIRCGDCKNTIWDPFLLGTAEGREWYSTAGIRGEILHVEEVETNFELLVELAADMHTFGVVEIRDEPFQWDQERLASCLFFAGFWDHNVSKGDQERFSLGFNFLYDVSWVDGY